MCGYIPIYVCLDLTALTLCRLVCYPLYIDNCYYFLMADLLKCFFSQDSNFTSYQRMWSFMESQRPSVFTTSNNEGVERVAKGKGGYAFLMESTTIEYVIERNCDLTQVGGLLDSKGYGIAMPPSM